MAFQSLYRRYRPRRFAEVRGQADVVRALRNSVREGRVAHAYLFSGPRGTGKTSTARILAKALNCTDLREGEPCCACESCLSIEAGTSYDLHELDAASNRGIDSMRDLIGRISLGSPGRTKVYILDEVHMLTKDAAAALLKTLEEPPDHVVFVLATTDPQKVIPTIRSRTQHFDFHLLPADELAEHVQWVIADAGLDADEAAVEYVLRVGGGSARDTLSALDKVVAAGGVPDGSDQVGGLVDALAANDTAACLAAVADAVKRGRDPRVLAEDLLERLRDVFLTRMGADTGHLSDTAQQLTAAWAESFSDRQVTAALEALGDALRDMRQAPDTRIPLELALIQITRSRASNSIDALIARIEKLERALAEGVVPAPAGAMAAAIPPGDRPEPDRPATSSASEATIPSAPGPASAAPTQRSGPTNAPGRQGRVSGADAARAAAAAAAAAKRGGEASRRTPSATPGEERTAGEERTPGEERAPTMPPGDAEPPGDAVPTGDAVPPGDAVPTGAAKPPVPPSGPEPAPTPAGAETTAAATAPTDGALPDREALTQAWTEKVLPTLKGLTKATYAAGHFEDTTDAAVFAVPGAVHRDKCEERRGEVEAALARHFGRPIPLRLVVAGETGRASDTAKNPRRPNQSGEASGPGDEPDPFEEERMDVGDLSELEDAPPDNRTPLDRLAEAFPGSDLVEEP